MLTAKIIDHGALLPTTGGHGAHEEQKFKKQEAVHCPLSFCSSMQPLIICKVLVPSKSDELRRLVILQPGSFCQQPFDSIGQL